MNPELAGLVQAWDDFRQAQGPEALAARAAYQSKLEDFLAARPRLDSRRVQQLIEYSHRQWSNAQKKTSTLPPKA